MVLALVPALISFFFSSGFNAFRLVTVAAAAALLSEMMIRKIFGRRINLYDGSAMITGILIALLLPPALPSWMVALGSAFAVVIGKEIFGGLGQNIFNPALVGASFLFLSFPAARDFLSTPSQAPAVIVIINIIAILLGGALLLMKRLIAWEVPFLYLGAAGLLSLALGQDHPLFSSPLLLAAFFIVTDPVTTPLTRTGNRWFALGAGLLSALFRQAMSPVEAFTSGILLMNGVTPWLDQWIHPRR